MLKICSNSVTFPERPVNSPAGLGTALSWQEPQLFFSSLPSRLKEWSR